MREFLITDKTTQDVDRKKLEELSQLAWSKNMFTSKQWMNRLEKVKDPDSSMYHVVEFKFVEEILTKVETLLMVALDKAYLDSKDKHYEKVMSAWEAYIESRNLR